MPNRVRVLVVRDEDRVELERLAHSGSTAARLAMRARIVLLSAEGLPGRAIASRLGCSEPTVVAWRRRYAARGLAGLDDAARQGGPVWVMTPEVRAQVLAETVTSAPGVDPPWSAQRLASRLATHREIDLSHDSIAALWRRCCLRRDPATGFTFRTEPALAASIHDLVALFVDGSWAAAVVRDRTWATEAAPPTGPPADLLGALEAVVGAAGTPSLQVLREVETFIAELTRSHPHGRLHLIQQGAGPHQVTSTVLAEHLRVQLHTTCADCSWPALVDCLHALTCHRSGGATVADLVPALRAHVAGGVPTGAFTWIRPGGGPDGTRHAHDDVHP